MDPARWLVTRRALLRQASAAGAVALTTGKIDFAAAAVRRPVPRSARVPFGTELEYYRSDPAHLEQRLQQCAKAGYTTIQTYVPWNVHENQRGTLDFTGKTHPVIVHDHVDEYQIETPDQEIAAAGLPSRVIANTNLISFIEACSHHGFDLILRPGPFISDEWRNGGLPDWLLLGYPNMFQLGPHGSALEPGLPFAPPAEVVVGGGPLYYFAGPSYASPDYLREVRRWMKTFAATVKPYLTTHGGPVSSMQVDDEICFYYRFGPFEVDYHPEMVKRFGATPPTDWPATGGAPTALRPALEWQRFKAGQLRIWLAEMAQALRDGGANVPITHEEELQLSPPANFAQLAQAVDILHPEFYLDPGPWAQPTLELCAAAVRGAQRRKRDVISAEMSESDVFIRHLLIGEGISGFLGFSYTEGIPDDAVADMSTLGRTLRLAGSRLAKTNRIADTAIIWPPEHLYTPYDSQQYGFKHDVRNVAERDIPALATLLIRAGASFDLLDTDVSQPTDYDQYPSVWLVAGDVLPRSAQSALVRYVKRGGKLICWPEAPTLDENYGPCTIVRDQLFGERTGPFYPEDGQTVQVLGTSVEVWRGVQTFVLRRGTQAVARRGREVCGYSRRVGRGHAALLGTWPVADSVPGREGDVFQMQDVPSSGASAERARRMVAKHWGSSVARATPTANPPGAGRPQKIIVFDYSNERRGGEVITGGTISYWDGENVVPLADINAATNTPEVTSVPFRPIQAAHRKLARDLHGSRLVCAPSDHRAQARLLRARDTDAATISVINRYETDLTLFITALHEGRYVRVPMIGNLQLPAGEALLLPLDWDLARNVTVEQASVQLLDAAVAGRRLSLTVTSSKGGEVVFGLPGRLLSATVGGRRVTTMRIASMVRLVVPAGEQAIVVRWR